jgi:hypothetical protein
MNHSLAAICCLGGFDGILHAARAQDIANDAFFENRVRPVLAGVCVRCHGESDEYGINVAKDPVHVHDFHATIRHLMGLNHERLTYRHSGRDYRLTDVAGRVLREVLA